MYVVPIDWTNYHATEGVVLVCKRGLDWLVQVCTSPLQYALHIDGKHKVHHGKWILVNVGVHSIETNIASRGHVGIVQSFRPIAHLFSKQHESEEGVVMILDALDKCAQQFLGVSFFEDTCAAPSIGIWDRSPGILRGWQRRFPQGAFATCWPHVARRVDQGEYVSKSDKDNFIAFKKHVQVICGYASCASARSCYCWVCLGLGHAWSSYDIAPARWLSPTTLLYIGPAKGKNS